jgi:hypothetical protein
VKTGDATESDKSAPSRGLWKRFWEDSGVRKEIEEILGRFGCEEGGRSDPEKILV